MNSEPLKTDSFQPLQILNINCPDKTAIVQKTKLSHNILVFGMGGGGRESYKTNLIQAPLPQHQQQKSQNKV